MIPQLFALALVAALLYDASWAGPDGLRMIRRQEEHGYAFVAMAALHAVLAIGIVVGAMASLFFSIVLAAVLLFDAAAKGNHARVTRRPHERNWAVSVAAVHAALAVGVIAPKI